MTEFGSLWHKELRVNNALYEINEIYAFYEFYAINAINEINEIYEFNAINAINEFYELQCRVVVVVGWAVGQRKSPKPNVQGPKSTEGMGSMLWVVSTSFFDMGAGRVK